MRNIRRFLVSLRRSNLFAKCQQFRGLKQTIDKHTLRCRNSARLLVELDWSLRALAVAELLRQKEWLAVYGTQARFAVAQIYDRAASTKEGGRAPAR